MEEFISTLAAVVFVVNSLCLMPQVYHIMNKSSDWWCARLARDVTADGAVGKQGWVPSSFLEKFTKSLSADEEAAYWMCTYSTIACIINN